MPETTGVSISHEELLRVAPSALEPDPVRPVGWRPVDEQLVTSVEEVGVVEFPLVRETDDGLFILDGTRRVEAAKRTDQDTIHAIRIEGNDADALAAWLSTHAAFTKKQVSDRDREASLRELVGGRNRSLTDLETSESIEEARYRLGLRTDADRIADATERVDGIGDATAERLADEFGDMDGVREASFRELKRVDGIGDGLASRLREKFENEVVAGAE
jgi:ParB-like chromosome segregation protein Spo0J